MIIYCCGEYQEVFDGLPNLNEFYDKRPTLLVLDDLMTSTDDEVVDLFTKISHHSNFFVMYLTQNIFYKYKIENAKSKCALPGLVQKRSRCFASN